MSDYKLNTHVHAVEVDDAGVRTGREQVFGPDDDLSKPENEWAFAAITNPDVWDGKKPPRRDRPAATGASSEVEQLRARIAQLEQEKAEQEKANADSGNNGGGQVVPPRSGRGSGDEKWREYAASQDVEVPADANREQVIAALEAAGKPTE